MEYKNLEEQDLVILSPMMKEAFLNDLKLHLKLNTNVIEGYDDGTYLEKLLHDEKQITKVVLEDNKIIGLYSFSYLDFESAEIDLLFIDTSLENKGYGSNILYDIFNTYKEINSWSLETRSYSKRNLRFYLKNGFKECGMKIYEDDSSSIILVKNKVREVTIRKYQELDFDMIMKSCEEVGWTSFHTNRKEDFKEALNNSLTLVALVNGEYAGFIRCLTDTVYSTYCTEILVRLKYRRTKIGTKLIEEVKKMYPKTRIDVLSDSITFFSSNNFFEAASGLIKF